MLALLLNNRKNKIDKHKNHTFVSASAILFILGSQFDQNRLGDCFSIGRRIATSDFSAYKKNCDN